MASVSELATQLGDSKQAVAYKAHKTLERMAMQAGDPAEGARREQVAAELAAELTAKTKPEKDEKGKDKPRRMLHSPRIRSRLAWLLEYVGGAKEVPALVECLGDLDLREAARMALDRNPSAEATEALIKALDQVGPLFRTGVVNSLGKRTGANVLAALQKTAEDANRPVRVAAVEALANLPDASSDAVIARIAEKEGCPRCRARACKARVRLAETLARSGDKAAAAKIFKAIAASDAAPAQKEAAEIGAKAAG